MKYLLALAAVVWLTLPFTADAAPRADNQDECAIVADMVLVASALGKNGLQEKRVAVMRDAYSSPLKANSKWGVLMGLAIKLADRKDMAEFSPSELGVGVMQACHQNRGNLDAIFGSEV
jgi:hypothetical protein